MVIRCLFPLALLAALPGQQRVSAIATILAHGTGCAADAAECAVTSREQLVAVLGDLGWQGEAPDVDFELRSVLLLPLGEGRGGEIRVTQVAGGDAMLVRIEGGAGAPIVPHRWVIVSCDEQKIGRPVFETDSIAGPGRTAFRTLGVGADTPLPAPGSLAFPTVLELVEPPDSQRLFADAPTFTRFCREQKLTIDGASLAPILRHVDFAKSLVLVRPMDPLPQRADGAQPLEFWFTTGGGLVRPYVHEGDGSTGAADAPRRYGMYVIPRVATKLDYERPIDGRRGEFQRTARFAIEDPATAPKMPVLRFVDAEVERRDATLCKRATTLTEWRELRRELDEFRDLPDDWCDFTSCAVIAIATEAGRVSPGFELHVTEEEGVDVLTATQRGPSGRDSGNHSYAMLAVVPRRPGQTAVVLRLECGPAPGTETTLRVFPRAH